MHTTGKGGNPRQVSNDSREGLWQPARQRAPPFSPLSPVPKVKPWLRRVPGRRSHGSQVVETISCLRELASFPLPASSSCATIRTQRRTFRLLWTSKVQKVHGPKVAKTSEGGSANEESQIPNLTRTSTSMGPRRTERLGSEVPLVKNTRAASDPGSYVVQSNPGSQGAKGDGENRDAV
jgi:hypothetical protein